MGAWPATNLGSVRHPTLIAVYFAVVKSDPIGARQLQLAKLHRWRMRALKGHRSTIPCHSNKRASSKRAPSAHSPRVVHPNLQTTAGGVLFVGLAIHNALSVRIARRRASTSNPRPRVPPAHLVWGRFSRWPTVTKRRCATVNYRQLYHC